jgi:hypothetical protein
MRENLPSAATIAEALPGPAPTVSPGAVTARGGQSAANRTQREACATCSSTTWVEAHFVNGSLVCADCAREIRHTVASKPMPPTKSQQMQLADWQAPHRSVFP